MSSIHAHLPSGARSELGFASVTSGKETHIFTGHFLKVGPIVADPGGIISMPTFTFTSLGAHRTKIAVVTEQTQD